MVCKDSDTNKATGQRIADAAAHGAMVDLLRAGIEPGALLSATVESNGWRVLVMLSPSTEAARAERLTDSMRDILAVLHSLPALRLTTFAVLAELDKRGLIHGERTIRGSLAELVRRGLICNSRCAPRGYYLPSTNANEGDSE